MTIYRPHRFPPLSRPRAPTHGDEDDAGQWQASLSDGFRKGMDDGFQQGYRSGLEGGHADGVRQGLEQGRQQGRQEVRDRLDALAAPIEALMRRLERLHSDYQSAKRREVVDLVGRVARQVIRCELALQPVQLLALVDETLASMPPAPDAHVEVYLNPEELRRIREIDPKRFRRWTLLADPRLEAGECHVRAGDHEVDAGCNQRLAACMERVDAQLAESDGHADEMLLEREEVSA